MKRWGLVLSLLVAAPALADRSPSSPVSTEASKEKFSLVHVVELAKLMEGHQVQVFDVNDGEFRAQNGIIPGATLLPGTQYDVAQFLPKDKNAAIAFYCANPH